MWGLIPKICWVFRDCDVHGGMSWAEGWGLVIVLEGMHLCDLGFNADETGGSSAANRTSLTPYLRLTYYVRSRKWLRHIWLVSSPVSDGIEAYSYKDLRLAIVICGVEVYVSCAVGVGRI
jgi:hypothetical protein